MMHSITFGPLSVWDMFDKTVSYAAGDRVRYGAKIYQFTAAHAAGPWLGTDAEDITRQVGIRNTREDWGLVLTSQPVFNPPAQKTKILDPPGGDGVIDLSKAVRGYPVYKNRTGNFTFVSPERFPVSDAMYEQIMDFIHGQTMQAERSDDQGWYYQGRFTVDKNKSRTQYGEIVIGYSVEPYKWAMQDSLDTDWLWDPFSFIYGVIRPAIFGGIEIGTTAATLEFDLQAAGRAPVKPEFSAKSGESNISISYGGDNPKTITAGHTAEAIDGLILYGGKWLLNGQATTVSAVTASGNGHLSIKFRPGRL